MHKGRYALFAAIAAGEFTYLLASMALLLIVTPFLTGILWAEIVTDVIFSALLFSAIYAVKRQSPYFPLDLGLATTVFLLRWGYHFTLDPLLNLLATSGAAIFFVLMAIYIVTFVFSVDTVTGDTIAGSICAYLLLGLAWAYVFALLEALDPATLSIARTAGATSDIKPFIYFSFVTLTTLGYGDLAPGTVPAQFLAIFEALMGQIYLVVLVARLVGLYGKAETVRKDS